MKLTKKMLRYIAREHAYQMLTAHAESADIVNQYRDYEHRLSDEELAVVSEELTKLANKIGVMIGEVAQ